MSYSIDGWATESPATIRVGPTIGLSTAPLPGVDHAIAWDVLADLGPGSIPVELRLTPSDDATGTIETGAPGYTGVFTASN